MKDYILTKEQARTFMVLKQGLMGKYRFIGKDGVLEFVEQAGCIQFDPIDVCGKNAEIVLQSRVKGFKKQMLYDLLYKDRKLIDYFDKNLSIYSINDWPKFSRIRERLQDYNRSKEKIDEVSDKVKAMINDQGPLSSKDIDLNEKVHWFWGKTKLARAALEALYYRGELIIHHKNGTNKYYALAEDFLPSNLVNAKDPFPTDFDFLKWRVLRRISGVGLLWKKASDAWLGMYDFKASIRNEIFHDLLESNQLITLHVEGIKEPIYALSTDESLLKEVLDSNKFQKRMELLAPLDSFLWDRKLIKALFDFDYKWEIYTPIQERKYAYYVLPILYGNQLIGRTEVVHEKKKKRLIVKNIWLEKEVKLTKGLAKKLDNCYRKFSVFNECVEPLFYEFNLFED